MDLSTVHFRLLVAEDNELLRKIYRRIVCKLLTEDDLISSFKLFEDGALLWEHFLTLAEEEQTRCIVVSDLEMPVMFGTELLVKIYEQNKETETFLVTGSPDDPSMKLLRDCYADFFPEWERNRLIKKPCEMVEIANAVAKVIRNNQHTGQDSS